MLNFQKGYTGNLRLHVLYVPDLDDWAHKCLWLPVISNKAEKLETVGELSTRLMFNEGHQVLSLHNGLHFSHNRSFPSCDWAFSVSKRKISILDQSGIKW